MPDGHNVLSWLHLGDLHITPQTEQNDQDLKRIFALARGLAPGSVDFALLPGDNAEDGAPEQFRLVGDAVASLPMGLPIAPGDLECQTRAPDTFYKVRGAERLPRAVPTRGHCLFRAAAVRAKVLDDAPITAAEMRANNGTWTPMRPLPEGAARWEAEISPGVSRVAVRARDAKGREDEDRVEPAGTGWTAPKGRADGSDADRVGAWPERGIFDTQLGPNRKGRKW